MPSEPYYGDDKVTIWHGDSLEVLAAMPAESVDAVVTDPPYGLADHPPAAIAAVLSAWISGDRTHVPTGAGFMGRTWDSFVPPPALFDECLRVLKPGGHLLAFAGARTADLMGMSIRLAGFEVRDTITWIYGSGYPKSLDVSKAIDRQRYDRNEILEVTAWVRTARATAEITNRDIDAAFGLNGMAGHWTSPMGQAAVPTLEQIPTLLAVLGVAEADVPERIRYLLLELNGRKGQPGEAWETREQIGQGHRVRRESTVQIVGLSDGAYPITAPATAGARRWQGWGTALKPASEPIVVARKPLAGTVAGNVVEHGTGALNIDGCRTGDGRRINQAGSASSLQRVSRVEHGYRDTVTTSVGAASEVAGRWPTNVVLSHAATPDGVDLCADECVPGCPVAEMDAQSGLLTSGANPIRRGSDKFRDAYGEFAGQVECVRNRGADSGGASRFFPVFRYEAKASAKERPRARGTAHPTVKPVDLMRWLVRLVTPPGGIVLEPFAGSGTTVEACIREGVACIAVEREATYLPLIMKRIRRSSIVDAAAVPQDASDDEADAMTLF